MSGGIKIGKIIRDVQADFFNTLYAKPGYGESDLVHFLTSEINNFSEEEQVKLKELIALQNTKAVSLVDSLKNIGEYATDLAKIDEEIKSIVSGKGISLENGIGENLNDQTVEVSAVPVEEAKAGDAPAMESEVKEEAVAVTAESNNEEVSVAEEKTESAESVEVESPLENTGVDTDTNQATTNNTIVEVPGVTPVAENVEDNVQETKAVEVPAVIDNNVVASEATSTLDIPSTGETTQDVAQETIVETPVVETAPINETVTVTTPSGGLEDDAVPVADTKPFELSPINEGVTPADAVAASTEASVENPQQIVAEVVPAVPVTDNSVIPQVQTEQPVAIDSVNNTNEDVLKFVKNDTNFPKAILVTGVQFGKLTSSRETQKALMSAKGAFKNTQADEQVLMANGLLAPTEDATKKQMEDIMNQANALYKEGKTAEAQALYNQVSSMNQTMQANTATAEGAKVLVNTPTPAIAA